MLIFRKLRLTAAAPWTSFRRSPVRTSFDLMLRLTGALYIVVSGNQAGVPGPAIFLVAVLVATCIEGLSNTAWKWCDEDPFLSSSASRKGTKPSPHKERP
jgi:hypothetical protein